MKKQLILIGIVTLLICVGLSGCNMGGQAIHAIKLNQDVGHFVNMTEEQMKNFPNLKESILMNKSIDVGHSMEPYELRGVLEYFNTNFICYQNEYYEIRIIYYD